MDVPSPSEVNPENYIIDKRVLGLAVLNHGAHSLVFFLGCAASGFTCHGDSMGGLMMLYALSIFLPQLALFVVMAGYFSRNFFLMLVAAHHGTLARRDVYYLCAYLASITLVILPNKIQ